MMMMIMILIEHFIPDTLVRALHVLFYLTFTKLIISSSSSSSLFLQVKKWATERGNVLPKGMHPGSAPNRSLEAGLLTKTLSSRPLQDPGRSKIFASVPYPDWLYQSSEWIQFSPS